MKSNLPHFPDFTPLVREHEGLLRAAFEAMCPDISEFTFAYQWVWRPYTRCRLSCFGGTVLVMIDAAAGGEAYLLPPLTADLFEAAAIVEYIVCGEAGGAGWEFARIPKMIQFFLTGKKGIGVVEEPNRADYLHDADDLRDLPGRRFHRKRNHVKKFRAACPGAEYRELDAALSESCRAFCRDWIAAHPNRDQPGLQREVETTIAMLNEREDLGVRGGALVAGGRVVAFALGEALNPETFVVRVEKGDGAIPGVYQALNQEVARHAAAGFPWINREQDLGLPGLRRAKESYFPSHRVMKYRVRAEA